MKSKCVFLVLLLLTACSSPNPSNEKKPFSLKALSAPLSYQPIWKGRVPTSEEMAITAQALEQDYKYLGSGGQCCTFESADGQYVIKFFKEKFSALPLWIEYFPAQWMVAPIKRSKLRKREQRREKAFSAFALCYDKIPIETGILYMHLHTASLNKHLNLIGPDQIAYQISLDDFAFVIQKKAVLAFEAINAKIAKGDRIDAIEAIRSLLDLHVRLYQKGIRNRDANFRSNCGFVDSRPIIIDVGRIVYSEGIKNPENYKRELARFLPRLRLWLQANHPDLLGNFEETVAKIMQSEP